MGRKIMTCPFFKGEIEHQKKRVGIKCEEAEIRFLTKEARREWVYPFCGSLGGYEECPIYKAICQKL